MFVKGDKTIEMYNNFQDEFGSDKFIFFLLNSKQSYAREDLEKLKLLEKEFIWKLLIVIDKDEIFIFFKLYNKTDNFYHIHLLKETRFKSLSIDSKKNLWWCLISWSKNANWIKLFLSHSSWKFWSIKSQETLNPILTKQITEVLQNKNLWTIETYIWDLTEPLTITN